MNALFIALMFLLAGSGYSYTGEVCESCHGEDLEKSLCNSPDCDWHYRSDGVCTKANEIKNDQGECVSSPRKTESETSEPNKSPHLSNVCPDGQIYVFGRCMTPAEWRRLISPEGCVKGASLDTKIGGCRCDSGLEYDSKSKTCKKPQTPSCRASSEGKLGSCDPGQSLNCSYESCECSIGFVASLNGDCLPAPTPPKTPSIPQCPYGFHWEVSDNKCAQNNCGTKPGECLPGYSGCELETCQCSPGFSSSDKGECIRKC